MNNFGDPTLPSDPWRLQAVSKREDTDAEIECLLDLWSKEFKVWSHKESVLLLQGHAIYLPRCPPGE